MAENPLLRASDSTPTAALRNSVSSRAVAATALSVREIAARSKIAAAGQIRSSGMSAGAVAAVPNGADGSEPGAAEGSWGRVNHNHLFVTDLGHGEAPFIGAVGKEAEDARGPLKPRTLGQGAG